MPKLGMEPTRRKQVLEALLKSIAKDGIEKVTLDKVAKVAGVSKGVVAYYFKSKNNLLVEGYQFFLDGYMLKVKKAFEDNQMETAKEMLMVIGESVLGLAEVENDGHSINQKEAGAVILQYYSRLLVEDAYKETYYQSYDEYHQGIVETLKYGQEYGEWAVEDMVTKATEIMAFLEGLLIFKIIQYQGDVEVHYKTYLDYLDTWTWTKR